MKHKFYDQIHQLAIDMVNDSELENTQSIWRTYQKLLKLCEDNEYGEFNHPFQWEALGDFTIDKRAAIPVYEKALKYAMEADLVEYVASIKFVMAEVLEELGHREQAFVLAKEANASAMLTTDLGLRKNISEFLLQLTESV